METRGGKRAGAGRPRKNYETITIRVPEWVAVEVKRRATELKVSQGEIITSAIELLVKTIV